MAIGSQLSPSEMTHVLNDWFAKQRPDADHVEVSDVRIPDGSGKSSDTVLLKLRWSQAGAEHQEALVVRIEPQTGMFRYYDLDGQYRVIRALHDNTTVPVPQPWACETDRSVLGTAFIAMGFVAGRVPADSPPYTASGWVSELAPESRSTLVDNALKALVTIHATNYQKLGLGFLDRSEWGCDVVERRIQYWRNTLDWALDGDSNPIAEAGVEWLLENRPSVIGHPVLVWGDARVGNIIFDEDLSVSAVLDWEMQTIGTREMDVAWWLFMQRHHTDVIGVPLPDGIPDRSATIQRYEELSGHTLSDLHYYEVLATVGCAALYHRTGNIMINNGLIPADSLIKLNNPATQVLAELLGLPAPEGVAQSYLDEN
jgi:aminoglycoside phosphotransferase (APT) family kinase protein